MAADYLTKKLGKQKFEYCMLLIGQSHVTISDTPEAKGSVGNNNWDGVTVDQIIAGSLGTIDGPEDDEVTTKIVEIFMNAGYNVMVIQSDHSVQGDPASAQVEVWHFWDNSEFKVFYKMGPFSVENLGNGGYENWAFGGNWVRYGADEKVVVFS
ncbi:unnamed protein product [Closterium sp. NIES-54]